MTNTTSSSLRPLWIPDLIGLAALALAATLPFMLTDLDLRLQHLFYRRDLLDALDPLVRDGLRYRGTNPAWHAGSWWLWRFLYRWGTWPALLTGLGALAYLLWSCIQPRLVPWRRHALLVILTLALGPGLLVNVVFKNFWGRPRPRETTEFNGRWTYQSFHERGVPGRGKSFPCGHSSMGYVFVVFYFLLRRRHRARALAAVAAAMVFGTAIGLARMAVGAHFASDVLWSALIPAALAFVLYYAILRVPQHENQAPSSSFRSRPLWLVVGAPLAGAGLIASGLAATPVYTELHYTLPSPSDRTSVDARCERCDLDLVFDPALSDRIEITGQARGFGWPWSRLSHRAVVVETNALLETQFRFRCEGGFSELSGQLELRLPPRLAGPVSIALDGGDIAVRAPDGATLPATTLRLRRGTLELPPSRQARATAQASPDGGTVYRLVAPP